jgi:tetratricopeptide (TPR) repeat protein
LYLVNNPLIKASDGLRRFWSTTQFTDYYALSNTSFWLEWRLWGNHATGYHVTNLLLHTVNALLIWCVLARLGVRGAWVAALVFALHPVNVMSVAWISERKNVLSLMFALLSVLAFLRWEEVHKWHWYGLAMGGFALALLSKTAIVMLPCALLLCLWWRHGRVKLGDVAAVAPFFVLSLAMGLVTVWFERQHGIGEHIVRDDNLAARLAGAGWAVWFYLGKALWPVNLSVIYPRWRIDSASALSWLPLAALVIGFAILWRRRDRWGRGPLFALGYFVMMLVPILGFFDIGFMSYSLVADHWQYAALPGVIALVCAGAAKTDRRGLLVCGTVVVAALLAVMTFRQTQIWHDDEMLWGSAIARNPNAWMAHNNLGNALLKRGLPVEAALEYAETIRLQPDYANAHYNLGIVLYQRGDYATAAGEFRETARLKPRSAEAYNNLGAALVQLGRTNEAVAEFETASQIAPRWAEPKDNLARLRTAQ